jgi:hypothetical protein
LITAMIEQRREAIHMLRGMLQAQIELKLNKKS